MSRTSTPALSLSAVLTVLLAAWPSGAPAHAAVTLVDNDGRPALPRTRRSHWWTTTGRRSTSSSGS